MAGVPRSRWPPLEGDPVQGSVGHDVVDGFGEDHRVRVGAHRDPPEALPDVLPAGGDVPRNHWVRILFSIPLCGGGGPSRCAWTPRVFTISLLASYGSKAMTPASRSPHTATIPNRTASSGVDTTAPEAHDWWPFFPAATSGATWWENRYASDEVANSGARGGGTVNLDDVTGVPTGSAAGMPTGMKPGSSTAVCNTGVSRVITGGNLGDICAASTGVPPCDASGGVPDVHPVLTLVVREPLPVVSLLLDLVMCLTRCLTGRLGVGHCTAPTRKQVMRTVCRVVVCTVAHHNAHKTIDGEAGPCAV